MSHEQFLTEVCNLAAAYLATQNLPNLTTVVANIEAHKVKLVDVLQQMELDKAVKEAKEKK